MYREEARKRAEGLVSKMTVSEMASQLKFNAEAIERLGIPEYNWWNEGLHGVARSGVATVFPQAIGLAATFDTELLHDVGECISTEGRAKYNAARSQGDRDIYKGLTFWSPNINIFRDPRWGRGHETYGEDPYLTGELAVQFIKGIQGDGAFMRAAACAKHFVAHSGPEEQRHFFDSKVSAKDLEETYLPAFKACVVDGHVEAVMGAYNRVNGEPSCGHPLIKKLLRDEWGFEGHFVSDCWAVRDFHESHHVTATPEESVKLALEAGCDLNCGCTYEKVMNAYDAGMIDEATIRESAIRLMTTRIMLGMFDETEYDNIPYSVVESREHLELSRRAAAEGIVLLKNDGILPLDASSMGTVAVIGPNANSRKALEGNYHGTSSRYETVLEGIQDALPNARVYFAEGCHLYKDNLEDLSKEEGGDGLAEACTISDLADVVILVVGLDETLEGEQGDTGNSDASGDKKDLRLPESQRRLMKCILDRGKPVVVINMAGSAIDLSLADEKAAAVIQAWYPGARGGEAVADVLFGKVSPSGKLPVTFYKSADDLPAFEDYSMTGRTYRYFTGEVLYPFGYGLTYGDCHVSDASISKIETEDDTFGGARIHVTAENRGRKTQDVLQVYITSEDDPFFPPNPVLCGFKRISLDSDTSLKIDIDIRPDAFTGVDDDGVRGIRGRRFRLFVGFSQPVKSDNGIEFVFDR